MSKTIFLKHLINLEEGFKLLLMEIFFTGKDFKKNYGEEYRKPEKLCLKQYS